MVAFCGMSIDNNRKHKNCFSSALGMLGITFHKNPFLIYLKSVVCQTTFHKNPFLIYLKSVVCQTLQMEHKMMSCRSKIMKKNLSMSESVGSE